MKIGSRVLKTAIGTGISIFIAQILGLTFYSAAGIITILCIKTTKKESMKAAGERFLACIIGLFFAGLFFEWLGYYPWVISLILLLIIPVCVRIRVVDGIVTSFVIILHVYIIKRFNPEVIWNELTLMIIGIGIALVFNLYMPSLEKELKTYQEKIEDNFKQIFTQYMIYLREGINDWDGKEITETAKLLKEAKDIASKEVENHLSAEDDSYYIYFQMREKQFDVLMNMLPIISSLGNTHDQGEIIADFLGKLKESIHPNNTVDLQLQALDQVKTEIKNSPLPNDAEEFVTCAALHQFVNELQRYLIIKKSLIKKQKGKRVFE